MNERSLWITRLKETAGKLLRGDGPARIRAGDPEQVESAISYLEADPYFSGTGYVKSYLVRYLKLVPFTPAQQERLRTLILRVIDTPEHGQGQHVCRLAASVQSPEFLAQVCERLKSPDHDARQRARNVYEYVQRYNQSRRA